MKEEIVKSANKKILFLPHAVTQMSLPERMISISEVRETVMKGIIIEEYQDDPRGKSCLMLYKQSGRAVHVVCAPKYDYLAIITAYIPDPLLWDSSLSKRK